MGKAFASELAALEDTLAWALTRDVTGLQKFVADVADRPLVAIGSGGSSTACHLAALLHRTRHRRPAHFTTPLDVLSIPAGLHRAGVFLASASGKNKDVLAAFDACIADEAPAVAAITLRAENPLKDAASSFARARVFAADAPAGKDGFLATNSLVATCTLIARAYGFEVAPPKTRRRSLTGAIFENRHMVQILHGGWGSPVATDLESKLNESALAAAQLADYRNFGHGRHLWLANRSAETVVVALVTPGTAAIADSTLKLFPKSIPVVRLDTTLDGPSGTIDLLVQAFHLVDRIGETRAQDPGRPHVPEFGRKLYRLTPPRVRPTIDAPIERKLWASPEGVANIKTFQQGLKQFLARARATTIGALALDYDGTLCTKDGRFDGLREDVVIECSRLLKAGIHLGIATGRGKSVREELQKALDRKLWARVHIGYYNGTDIGALGDNNLPARDEPNDEVLKRAQALLSADGWLTAAAKVDPRPRQITVEPRGATRTDALAAHVMARLAPLDGEGVRVVVSSHSLDVLGPTRGKGSLVSWLREQIGDGRDVLCIGDRGAWPGNDYALLAEPMSLSVDEVSSLNDACWNLAPRGISGPDATLLYLRAVKARGGIGTFSWKESSVP
ncbi:HAD hydrolase family protein [Corallococcus sp. BB11-1]|uniref:HAD hydrolase family protein n=1 Tax=Corallococcus sp. BB11-1 TaxID=2996783 RepID=UPI002271F35C|nr:HAD hydrolase family protein [Corallococcus sp. BB11-1]MCY1037020.1 HAD hydrolase family protein [Corallococcus sp. BB11-1]